MKRAQTNDEGIVAGPVLLQQVADAPSAFGRERASHQTLAVTPQRPIARSICCPSGSYLASRGSGADRPVAVLS